MRAAPQVATPTVSVATNATTSRISWVAYAVEEMASEAKTGSAIFLLRR